MDLLFKSDCEICLSEVWSLSHYILKVWTHDEFFVYHIAGDEDDDAMFRI